MTKVTRKKKQTLDRGPSGLIERDEKLSALNGQGDQVDKGVEELKDKDQQFTQCKYNIFYRQN